uniref:Hyp27 n=1 Tax=Moniliophthora roreri (strain MCA 2997) TaxID=1381753 RepID=F2WVM7_MONRO|nr:hyp27 [Moniliophthora roreri]ADO51610.1 hyp27 [Moniliophthora roreri]
MDPKDSSSDSINWSKYLIIIGGILIVGGLVYHNWDWILSYLGYLPKKSDITTVNTDQDLIDLSSPINSSNSSPLSDQIKRYFKDPDLTPQGLSSSFSLPNTPTKEILDYYSTSTSSNSPTTTNSSLTIKPEEIIIKTDSPEPKKILLKISEETLNKLREKGELSPLDKDITTQIEK